MLKDFIDCKNDATSKFLTDAPVTTMMSEETPSESPVAEHVTTITLNDVYEIECSSVAEEIIIEDEKCYDSSSPESEIVEVQELNDDSVEELQSPIAEEVDQLINNEHINSKHVLENSEPDEFILPDEAPEPSNNLMEIDTPFLNENSPQTTNDVEIVPKEPVEDVSQSKPIEPSIQPSEIKPLPTESTDKPYKCHICGKLFSRNSSLICHVRLHIEGPNSLLRGSSQPLTLKSHLPEFNMKKEDTKKEEIIEPEVDLNTSDIVPYDETATGVLNSSRESNELADDDDKRDYKCIICEKTFSRKSSLAFHYKFHPKSPTSKGQDDITAIVAETINDESVMDIDSVPSTNQHKCDKCDRSFAEKGAYLWHLKMHETNVRRKSSDCNSLSTNKTDSIKDSDVDMMNDADVSVNHTDTSNDAGNLYKCPLCPRSFPQIRGLTTHSVVHRRKPVNDQSKGAETLSQIVYEEVSSRKYDCSKKLHNHDDKVTKLYKCNVCCKCFCDIGNLKRHLAHDHKEDDTSEASDNDVVVRRKKSISAMHDSKLPRKRVSDDFHHPKAPVSLRGLYKCGVCNEAFDEIQSLSDHVAEHLKVHNDSMQSTTDESSAEELCCVVCEKTFRNQNSLSRHMNEHRRREEEILVRVTSSGRKIRERRPSEDMSTTSPFKCIPCNRYFESIRAKRIHESSKHPPGLPEPTESELGNDDDAADDNNEEYICDCCDRSWPNLRSLSMHKSWKRQKLSSVSADKINADLSIDDEDENEDEEMDSFELDDYTAPEENKTENDVTSSVKCGCCNELFPNIPALNAHLSGQTNGPVADASTLPDYERKDLTNCDSLRDLVKCDRCDKFCSSIPALKLHIMSDHTKKSVPQSSTENSTVTAPKPAAVPDRLKKNVSQNNVEASSSPVSKSNIADRTKKHVSQSSVESSPATKSQVISERKRSVSKSSAEIQSAPALKYQIISGSPKSTALKSNSIPDRTKKSPVQSSVENSNAAPKSNTSDLRRKSVSQSLTENLSTSVSKSNIPDQSKKSISQSSTEDSLVPALISKSGPPTEISNMAAESSNIPDLPEKTVQNLTESSSIPAAESNSDISSIDEKFELQDLINSSNIAGDQSEKSVPGDSIENSSISDNEKSTFQDTIENSSLPASVPHIIFDHTEKSTENATIQAPKLEITSDQTIETVPEIPAENSVIPDPPSKIISDDTKQPESANSTEQQTTIPVPAADVTPTESPTEPQPENEKLTEAIVKAPRVSVAETGDKPIVIIAQSVRRRKSAVGKIVEQNISLLQCDLCDETFTSNRALNSHKSTHVIEPSFGPVVDSDSSKEPLTFACCDKIFASMRALKIHQNHHAPAAVPALCPTPTDDSVADISAASISTLAESDDDVFREHVCTICEKKLGSKKSLKSHRATHFKSGEIDPEEDKLPFQCLKCNKKFETKSSLRVHKAYHTNVENKTPIDHGTYTDMRNGMWKCNSCEREFDNVRGFNKHYSYAHKERDPLQSFPCSKCDRSFDCSQGLAGHTWAAHLKNSSASNSGPYKELKNGMFKCNVCDKQCGSAGGATRHHNAVHREKEPEPEEEYPCSKCDRKFNCSQGLAGHMSVHLKPDSVSKSASYSELENGMFECKFCDKVCETERGIIRHHNAVHREKEPEEPEEEYPCSKCDRKFNCSQGLAGHMSVHLKPDPASNSASYTELENGMFECKLCDKVCETERGIIRHHSMVHKEKDPDEREEEYSCPKCDRTFNCSQGLAGHMWAHKRGCARESLEEEDLEDLSCSHCNKSFSNSSNLRKHISKVHDQEPELEPEPEPKSAYYCSTCEKSYASNRNLRRHLRSVHNMHSFDIETEDEQQSDDEEKYPCSECGRVYDSLRGLNGHMHMHQQYVCGDCNQTCSNIRIYNAHKEVCPGKTTDQENDFPSEPFDYKCDQCDRSFPSARSLGSHKPVHYNNDSDVDADNEADDQSNQFKCSRCKRSFDNARSLGVHMNCHTAADNPQELLCPKCDRIFPSFRSLSAHFTTHRGEEGRSEFPCPKCKNSFNNIRSLYEHFGDVHKKVTKTKRSFRHDSKSIPGKESETPDSKSTSAKELEKIDSKSTPVKEPEKRSRSRGRQSEPAAVPEASVDSENYPCAKCGEQFTSDRSLSSHRRKCTSRSKSVEDSTSPRSVKLRSKSVGDRTSTRETPIDNEDVSDTPNSSIRKSRRLQSFAEAVSQQQQQPDEQMDIDLPIEYNITKDNPQSSCTSRNQPEELDDTAPKPNCDICALTFDDFKTLATHIADLHESTPIASIAKQNEFSEPRTHHCTQCDQFFTNRVGLRKHSLTHSEPLPMPWEPFLECSTCLKKFSTRHGLTRHSLIHKNISNPDEPKASKDAKMVTNSTDKSKAESKKSAKESERLTNGVDESINGTNSVLAETPISDNGSKNVKKSSNDKSSKKSEKSANNKKPNDGDKSSNDKSTKNVEKSANNKKTNDAEKSSNDKTTKNIEKSANNKKTNDAEKSNNVKGTKSIEKSSSDKKNDSEKSINDSNSNHVDQPVNDTPIVEKKSSFDIANESINDTPSSAKSNDQTWQNQDTSVDHHNQSENATGSSCESQSDQSTCADDPNTSRLSLPIVSDEPISCLSCKICSRQFSHVKAFNKHVQWHKFNDDAVDGEETTPNDSPKHLKSNGPVPNGTAIVELLAFVKCDICSETFKRADTLKKHALDVHRVTITSPILYQCGCCEKSFPRGNSLFMHLKSHTNKGSGEEDSMPFECASCEKCFKLKDDLLEHVKSHLNGVEPDSPTVPVLNGSSDVAKVNGDNSDPKTISDDLENDRNDPDIEPADDVDEPKSRDANPMYECSDCNRKFVRKCYLGTHIRSHKKKAPSVDTNKRSEKLISPPKQHKCPVCDERFRVKTSLACHIQKHSSDKVLRKSLKRSNDDNSFTAEDGVRSSKRAPKDIS